MSNSDSDTRRKAFLRAWEARRTNITGYDQVRAWLKPSLDPRISNFLSYSLCRHRPIVAKARCRLVHYWTEAVSHQPQRDWEPGEEGRAIQFPPLRWHHLHDLRQQQQRKVWDQGRRRKNAATGAFNVLNMLIFEHILYLLCLRRFLAVAWKANTTLPSCTFTGALTAVSDRSTLSVKSHIPWRYGKVSSESGPPSRTINLH